MAIVTNKFKLLVLSYGLSTFSEGIIIPVYAFFVQNIGGGILETTGTVSIFLIVSGITTLFIHKFEWSQKHALKLLVFGWLIWLFGIICYFLISNLTTLIIAQVLIAIGNAIANPAFDSELMLHTNKNSKSYEWGIFEASQDIFNGIAAFVAGVVVVIWGFNTLIVIMVLTASISFALIYRYYRYL